ncbi:hypothetical protein BP5796_07607 [Coleophoma crateriformis]|uniref:Uncharacterized protein n=1 Tax=Coleophoma crateriformis TaxID=565419 RepID=A0A3D8RJE7_9HELO|nr:hypothetical protein BP5796_07607 [Coleophoma crateriformis]
MAEIKGGSAHAPQESFSEPREFKIQVLPAGSAPKKDTFQPDVNGELAAGQPNNSADTTYDNATEGSKVDVHKGLGGKDAKEDEEENSHVPEIKSASEKEPETADMI